MSMITKLHPKFFLAVLLAAALAGCKPEGFINRTRYQGEKVVNTCADFEEEARAMVEANQGVSILRVAEYDNSQFEYFYLEPGQMEIVGDTLYARFINDINYERYLAKRVAVQVRLSYRAQDHLRDMEQEPEGELGNPLVIDLAYLNANREPFFVYKFPVGNHVDGKQLSLTFSIVQYSKNGEVKKVFCNSVEMPLGPVEPGCCTDQPWQTVNAQSVVQMPELQINDEQYRYQGFAGTLNLIFPMNSVAYNQAELNDVLLNYISKYAREGFRVRRVSLNGYASQGGTQAHNQRLSANRSRAVYDALVKYFEQQGQLSEVQISHMGNGEDWDRFNILVKTAAFTDTERARLLEISNSPTDPDQKEAELRKLPFWNKLVSEVLKYCRHVMAEFTFEYQPDRMFVETYPTQMPVIAPELYNVATKRMTVTRFQQGSNPDDGLRVLNTLIDANANRTANLYAMRSTYQYALNNVRGAITDIEAAMNIDRENSSFGVAALAYKTRIADSYSLNDRMQMMNQYNTFIGRYPNNSMLRINRVVMMDKIGFISGALAEYQNLISEASKTAALLNNRGVARMKTNRIVEAQADFSEAIRQDPNIAEPYFNLAIIHAYQGAPEEVINNLRRAVQINPGMKQAANNNPAFAVVRANPRFQEALR